MTRHTNSENSNCKIGSAALWKPVTAAMLASVVVLYAGGCKEQAQSPKADPARNTASEQVDESVAGKTRMGNVDGARIIAAGEELGNWLAHGRTYDEQRFSPVSTNHHDPTYKF